MKMAAWALAPRTSPASARLRNRASDRPSPPSTPTFTKSRRVMPSQVRVVAMIGSFQAARTTGELRRVPQGRPLMVHEEFVGVDQRPEQVAQSRIQVRRFLEV